VNQVIATSSLFALNAAGCFLLNACFATTTVAAITNTNTHIHGESKNRTLDVSL